MYRHWLRCVELVSCITQQAVQHVARHGVLSSCTYFSQLVAYKAECWVSYTVIELFHCNNQIRVLIAYQGAASTWVTAKGNSLGYTTCSCSFICHTYVQSAEEACSPHVVADGGHMFT